MIVFLRSKEPFGDSRQEKYYTFYDKNDIEFIFIGWDRRNFLIPNKNQILFKTKYEKTNKLNAIFFRIKWFVFVIKSLTKIKEQINIIHACDLDCALPSVIFKLMQFKKKPVKIIFDVFDWYGDSLKSKNIFLNAILTSAEKLTVKHCDEIIICEPERRQQIKFPIKIEPNVLRNIPYFEDTTFLKECSEYKNFKNEKLIISYIGGFYEHRLLDELLDLAENEIINLNIGGFGNRHIEERCKTLSNKTNIKYHGKVRYEDGLNIMYNSDIIYAMYSIKNANHYFAAPNKFYESLFLGKPILSNHGTILSEKIQKLNIGYIVKEDYTDIKNLLIKLENKRNALDNISKQCRLLWDEEYSKYNDIFFNEYYAKVCANS